MSQHPSLNAALKRLEAYADLKPNHVYVDNTILFVNDVALLSSALRLVADCANHANTAGTQPVFVVRLPCHWEAADKGFLHALSQCKGKTVEDVG